MDMRSFFRISRMDLFRRAGVGRHTNDANNKAREEILVSLYDTTDESLQELREKWRHTLAQLYTQPYDDILVKKKGGRGANHDFTIDYLLKMNVVYQLKAEFKHNSTKIDKLPEYYSPAADKPYIKRLYADFFYDYLDRICDVYPDVSPHKLNRENYLKLVHNSGYDRHPFFRNLYDMEKTGTPEQAKQKQQIVHESIKDYLSAYAFTLDVEQLTRDLRERQSGKVFLLWNLSEFVVDSIRDDEMEITHVEKVKNNNTIIAVSKAGTRHNMLLRWKNHLGILYPAWQISLSR